MATPLFYPGYYEYVPPERPPEGWEGFRRPRPSFYEPGFSFSQEFDEDLDGIYYATIGSAAGAWPIKNSINDFKSNFKVTPKMEGYNIAEMEEYDEVGDLVGTSEVPINLYNLFTKPQDEVTKYGKSMLKEVVSRKDINTLLEQESYKYAMWGSTSLGTRLEGTFSVPALNAAELVKRSMEKRHGGAGSLNLKDVPTILSERNDWERIGKAHFTPDIDPTTGLYRTVKDDQGNENIVYKENRYAAFGVKVLGAMQGMKSKSTRASKSTEAEKEALKIIKDELKAHKKALLNENGTYNVDKVRELTKRSSALRTSPGNRGVLKKFMWTVDHNIAGLEFVETMDKFTGQMREINNNLDKMLKLGKDHSSDIQDLVNKFGGDRGLIATARKDLEKIRESFGSEFGDASGLADFNRAVKPFEKYLGDLESTLFDGGANFSNLSDYVKKATESGSKGDIQELRRLMGKLKNKLDGSEIFGEVVPPGSVFSDGAIHIFVRYQAENNLLTKKNSVHNLDYVLRTFAIDGTEKIQAWITRIQNERLREAASDIAANLNLSNIGGMVYFKLKELLPGRVLYYTPGEIVSRFLTSVHYFGLRYDGKYNEADGLIATALKKSRFFKNNIKMSFNVPSLGRVSFAVQGGKKFAALEHLIELVKDNKLAPDDVKKILEAVLNCKDADEIRRVLLSLKIPIYKGVGDGVDDLQRFAQSLEDLNKWLIETLNKSLLSEKFLIEVSPGVYAFNAEMYAQFMNQLVSRVGANYIKLSQEFAGIMDKASAAFNRFQTKFSKLKIVGAVVAPITYVKQAIAEFVADAMVVGTAGAGVVVKIAVQWALVKTMDFFQFFYGNLLKSVKELDPFLFVREMGKGVEEFFVKIAKAIAWSTLPCGCLGATGLFVMMVLISLINPTNETKDIGGTPGGSDYAGGGPPTPCGEPRESASTCPLVSAVVTNGSFNASNIEAISHGSNGYWRFLDETRARACRFQIPIAANLILGGSSATGCSGTPSTPFAGCAPPRSVTDSYCNEAPTDYEPKTVYYGYALDVDNGVDFDVVYAPNISGVEQWTVSSGGQSWTNGGYVLLTGSSALAEYKILLLHVDAGSCGNVVLPGDPVGRKANTRDFGQHVHIEALVRSGAGSWSPITPESIISC